MSKESLIQAPPQKMWVAMQKVDYGYSAPLAIFSDHRVALVFAAGARAAYGSLELHELTVNDVEKHL
jgi:hypothetical protein